MKIGKWSKSSISQIELKEFFNIQTSAAVSPLEIGTYTISKDYNVNITFY